MFLLILRCDTPLSPLQICKGYLVDLLGTSSSFDICHGYFSWGDTHSTKVGVTKTSVGICRFPNVVIKGDNEVVENMVVVEE